LYAPYVAIDSFSAWADLTVDVAAWDAARQSLERARQSVSSHKLRRAVEVAMRAAAVETGATDGGDEVERDIVALQSTAWQAAIRDTTVRELFGAQLRGYRLAREAAMHLAPITEAWLTRLHTEVCASQRGVRILTLRVVRSGRFSGEPISSCPIAVVNPMALRWHMPRSPTPQRRCGTSLRSSVPRASRVLIRCSRLPTRTTAWR